MLSSRLPHFACSCLFAVAITGAIVGAEATLEDPVARAALPEIRIIPAATPEELSPAKPVPIGLFNFWPRSQGDNGSRRYSALKQINKENVKDLEVAWTYRSGDGAQNIQCTPIIVDGVMYGPTPGYALVAVNAATGKEIWRHKVDVPSGAGENNLPARRGLVYWPGDASNAPRLLFGSGEWYFAVDPKTGKLLEKFGDHGRTPIPGGAKGIGSVYQHVFVVAGGQDYIHGFDVRDGKLLWSFSTIAQGGEFGEPYAKRRGGANNWAGMAVDDARGIAYFTLGDPHPNMVGISRPGDNLFSNCILALDALTGKYRWHFQGVRHDLWDLDVTGPPNLVTITRDGRKIDAVTAVSKGGLLLLVDRESGKPIFPFRLRRAPVSKLPGETTAPYQPDPELPEQISKVTFDPAEITDRTPEARAAVEKMVARSSYGFYEPFTLGKPNLFRGSRGGGEWGGSGVDVPTGRLYVTSNRWISRITVIPNDEGIRDPKYPPSAGEIVYQQNCMACHGEGRQGSGIAPPLHALKLRMNEDDVLAVLKTGRGAMPPAPQVTDAQKKDLLDFLYRRHQPPSRPAQEGSDKYTFDGFNFLVDHEGYPGIKPPWGELTCYDLSTGKKLWHVPLGEHEELTKQGMPITGQQNLGGASVTAGGLVFVAGTSDEKLRAFDADTGKELWAAKLPFAGTAAPAVYEIDGQQYVVITATGGGRVGGKSGPGDAYVAFALPKK